MKNKILTISIIFILLSFIFINSNAFAYSEEFEYNSNSYTFYIPDGAYNAIQNLDLVANENYYYFAVGANSQVYVYLFSSPVNCFLTKGTNNTDFNFSSFENAYYMILYENGSIKSNVEKISSLRQSSAYGVMSERKFYYASTVNIYTDSSCTDFFFNSPVTEQPETIPETVEIPAVETVEQIPVAMTETLKMIIPVGLVVLSVVLVIYLARRLIYQCS